MKVSVRLTEGLKEPYAVIYAGGLDDEVRRAAELLTAAGAPVVAESEDRLIVLKPGEIYMIRVENGTTVIYGWKGNWAPVLCGWPKASSSIWRISTASRPDSAEQCC